MEKLGPYDLLDVVGRGGMGSVYRARNRETGELHAVKLLLDNFSDQQHFRNRFESEINALIKLDHPNIVRIISFGQEMGNLFFAMELVEGSSLFQLQKKAHRFDWREILAIAKQLAKGLRHAHDRGIVHRDLKPGNVLMPIDADGKHGEVKLTDFGIAKRFGTSQNTGDNLIGTMDFMSPEQAKGQPATARSDLYSLGTVLYTLLSGKPPFSSNSFEESLRKLTRVPAPPISSVVANVPPTVDALIQKLMAKQPEKRIPTAQALLYKIEEIEQELIETSQAKTVVPELPKSNETIELATGLGSATRPNTDPAQENPAGGGLVKSSSRSRRVAANDDTVASRDSHSSEAKARSVRLVDYHNTVTDHLRAQSIRDGESTTQSPRNIWWIAAALVGVIALASWGLMRANRPKPADELYRELQSRQSNSVLLEKLSKEFLASYADDPRAEEVKKWEKNATDDRQFSGLLNRLTAQSTLTNGSKLSEIEKQFVEINSRYGGNKDSAAAKLAAFIAVHNGSQLSGNDKLCIDAASFFENKYREEAKVELQEKLQFIKRSIETAKSEESSSTRIERYRSLLDLYGDEKWNDSQDGREAQQLLDSVRQEIGDKASGN